jgi:hypothetical protein
MSGDIGLEQGAYEQAGTDQIAAVSAFGGHPLAAAGGGAAVSDTSTQPLATLVSLGIEDGEQLVAIAAIPEVRGELEKIVGGDAVLRQLLDNANGSLPPERAALVSAPAPRDLGLGVLMPTAEMIAAAEAPVAGREADLLVALPTSVNLIQFMSPVRNQAARGTCVAFALTALNEYIVRRRGSIQNLSEQHLYYETKLIDGAPAACGTWQVKAVLALRNRGECREVVWPYNPNPPCNNHGALPAQARPDGLHFRLATIQVPAKTVAAYKAHMARQRPVTLSIPVYNSWYSSAETRRSGRITMRIGNEQAVGGHAVCLVGYQDTPASPGGGYFIVRNSWDTSWGYQSPYGGGYGTIPYQYITNDGWEAFTAIVPGIGESDVDEQSEGETAGTEQPVVTIEVARNVKITITGAKPV